MSAAMTDLTSQFIEQVRTARDAGRPLEIRAGGSKQFYGRLAQGDLLSLAAHQGVVDYQPEELVLTARSGTPLAVIEAALAEHGQHLPSDPPRFGSAGTLGGSLACNLSGPGRPWMGSLRDQVLGLRLINGLGEHLRFGGQVMKNVAGYDVSRLQAGAMGCLGVITEITVKVLPRPAACITLALPCAAASDSISFLAQFARRPQPLAGACWLQGVLYLRLAGAGTAVEGASRDLQDQHGAEQADDIFWQRLRDHQLDFFTTDDTLWRGSTSATASLTQATDSLCLDWGGSQRWCSGPRSDKDAPITAFRGGDRRAEVFPPLSREVQNLHQRLKQAFDPDALFNRGRLYSWL